MNLYDTLNYRDYLRATVDELKLVSKNFSYRGFAKSAGFGSPGYLLMVMNGQRNLTPKSINKFAKALKLDRKLAAYFEALVLFNQATSEKDRDLYFDRLMALKPAAKITGLQKDQYDYYRHTHFVVIREMVALPDFQENPSWIARHLRPPIRAQDAAEALQVLLRLGLLARNEQGRLIQAQSSLATPTETVSFELFHFHREMLGQARDAMAEIPPADRDITALTIPIPHSKIPAIKNMIVQFREQMMDFINKGETNYHEVYQINIQLFPVTRTKRPVHSLPPKS